MGEGEGRGYLALKINHVHTMQMPGDAEGGAAGRGNSIQMTSGKHCHFHRQFVNNLLQIHLQLQLFGITHVESPYLTESAGVIEF